MRAIETLRRTPPGQQSDDEWAMLVDDERQNRWARPREKQPPAPGLLMRRMADIVPVPIRWLWPNVIPCGKLTLLVGDPGLGKSLISLDMTAHVSQGKSWHDGSSCPTGRVLLLSAEDDAEDTIFRRLEVAGADLHLIDIIEGVLLKNETRRSFNLQVDIGRLGYILGDLASDPVKLIVIDPIAAYLGDTDSHVNSRVRALLEPLADLAARWGVAIVGITHLNKASSQAIYRIQGSLAFTAAARAIWVVCRDPENESRMLMLPLKLNLAANQGGFAYSIQTAEDGTPYLSWERNRVHGDANQLLCSENPGKRTMWKEVAEWLVPLLADGPVPVTDILREAYANGISEKTLWTASQKLHVLKRPSGYQQPWLWQLPPEVANKARDSLRGNRESLDDRGNLCSPSSAQLTDVPSQIGDK